MAELGIKELYEVSIRATQPIEIDGIKYDINETVISFDKAEIANLDETKYMRAARGGESNMPLVFWETDKKMDFSISKGTLTPQSWAVLSNSKLRTINKASVFFKEKVHVVEHEIGLIATLTHIPNYQGKFGVQGNPKNKPLPLGRQPDLELKPVPPKKDCLLFLYNEDGKKIKDFEVKGNQIRLFEPAREIYADYTYDFTGETKVLKIGERIFNGFFSLTGKMSVKNDETGEVTTAVIKMPKIKLSSSISIQFGSSYSSCSVDEFHFSSYPEEEVRNKKSTCEIMFLDEELTKDYL